MWWQLWPFWVAPIAGAILGALAYRAIAPVRLGPRSSGLERVEVVALRGAAAGAQEMTASATRPRRDVVAAAPPRALCPSSA